MANTLKKVIGLSGSTRQNSTNHQLLKAIAELMADRLEIILFNGIGQLPHFNPDLADEATPPSVTGFKHLLNDAQGVIICTPEYAHGVPGTLKNALDWTVSSGEFSQKPTVLITASTDGRSGHASLLETLKVLEAKNIDQLQLLISFARTRISASNKIIHEPTLAAIQQVMNDFWELMTNLMTN